MAVNGTTHRMVIRDSYESLGEAQAALRSRGLESAGLILGVDFTKSNEWTGAVSFNKRCLHTVSSDGASVCAALPRARVGGSRLRKKCLHSARAGGAHASRALRPGLNPYEQTVAILGRTLQAFDDDGLVPCYGFGDASTSDNRVFSFFPGDRPASSFGEALERYRALVSTGPDGRAPRPVSLAGPTSFGPNIRHAAQLTADSGNQFHVLLLVADGQVTRSADVADGELSPQEKDTIEAIVEASKTVPLAIVMVGVGDGPWDTMRAFDDALPERAFDNLQFVEFSAIRCGADGAYDRDFALACLQELPQQYLAAQRLGLVGVPSRELPAALCGMPPADPPVAASAPPAPGAAGSP
jgi:E3 ubiquitin-protein ligase RGLG